MCFGAEDEPVNPIVSTDLATTSEYGVLSMFEGRPRLVCGRRPADTHHLRFAQSRALGRKAVTRSLSRLVGDITAKFIIVVTNPPGGITWVLIRLALQRAAV